MDNLRFAGKSRSLAASRRSIWYASPPIWNNFLWKSSIVGSYCSWKSLPKNRRRMLVFPTLGAPSTTIRWQFLGLVRPISSRSTDLFGSRSFDTCRLPELADLLATTLLSCCLQRPLTVLMMPKPVFDKLETLGCWSTVLLCRTGCVTRDWRCPATELNISKMPSTGR